MTEVYFETTGDHGPRVLMIQGTGVGGCGWSPQVEGLRNTHQLAWFDHRGVGSSAGQSESLDEMVDDALSVMDALSWSDAHIVGHSLGGLVAQRLAIRHRERVRSLALLCTLLDGRASVGFAPKRAWVQMRTAMGTKQMRRRAFFELVSDPDISCTEANIRTLEDVFGRALHALPKAAFKQVRIVMKTHLGEQLRKLTVPAFVLSATDDLIASAAQGRALAEVLDAEFLELPGGHAITIQDAQRINDVLVAFWHRIETTL